MDFYAKEFYNQSLNYYIYISKKTVGQELKYIIIQYEYTPLPPPPPPQIAL